MEIQNVQSNDAAPRLFLQPIAAPSILGLFGFAVATMMVSTHMMGWYGNQQSPFYLFPFAAFFGGLAQFMAGIWSFRARDGLAVAMHGMWGSFWMAYGVLYFMAAARYIALPTAAFPELGLWFVGLAWVTLMGAWAAGAVSLALFAVLALLAAGSIAAAIGFLSGVNGWSILAGYLFFLSAICAWYTASALMLESAYGRVILPLGKAAQAERAPKVSLGIGEPGVIHGQ